jgi:uncharacterized RDD family membrane protein YckC
MSKTIDITTTQNVTIEYDLAPLRERALAWVLDLVLVIILYIMFFQFMRFLLGDGMFANMGWTMIIVLFPFLLFFFYNILFEILKGGQTPGKTAMSIKVVRLDGKDPEWSDVLLRAVLHLVDSLFSFAVIGSLLIKTTSKSQRLGDMAANTTVIKIQGLRSQFRLDDILNISTISNYEPVYPQVRSLGEKDMIYIKTVLLRFQRYPNQAHHEVVEDLVSHLMPVLNIEQRPKDRVEFLRTLLRDYIVLTR